jgi:hypothetical protein
VATFQYSNFDQGSLGNEWTVVTGDAGLSGGKLVLDTLTNQYTVEVKQDFTDATGFDVYGRFETELYDHYSISDNAWFRVVDNSTGHEVRFMSFYSRTDAGDPLQWSYRAYIKDGTGYQTIVLTTSTQKYIWWRVQAGVGGALKAFYSLTDPTLGGEWIEVISTKSPVLTSSDYSAIINWYTEGPESASLYWVYELLKWVDTPIIFQEFTKGESWSYAIPPYDQGPWTVYGQAFTAKNDLDWNTFATYFNTHLGAGEPGWVELIQSDIVQNNNGVDWDIYSAVQLPRGISDDRDLYVGMVFYNYRDPYTVEANETKASIWLHYTEHDAERGYWIEGRTTISGVSTSEWVSIPRAKIYTRLAVDENDGVKMYWSFINDPRNSGAKRTGTYWTEITPSGDLMTLEEGWTLGLKAYQSANYAPLHSTQQTRGNSTHIDFIRDKNVYGEKTQAQVYATKTYSDGRIILLDPIED